MGPAVIQDPDDLMLVVRLVAQPHDEFLLAYVLDHLEPLDIVTALLAAVHASYELMAETKGSVRFYVNCLIRAVEVLQREWVKP